MWKTARSLTKIINYLGSKTQFLSDKLKKNRTLVDEQPCPIMGAVALEAELVVFTARWPFKTSPCFHWHGDVRAAKDSSLSSPNGEGNGPGTESCFRRETFTPLTKAEGRHSSLE